jgi:GTP-binding protein Era
MAVENGRGSADMTDHRSGFIAILGKPNVGKSTLVNALLGQKIAAVSPRPQTTRRRQLGILTLPDAQLVFVDTPGVHTPRHKLGQFFNQEAEEALDGVDVVLFLVDSSIEPDEEDRQVASLIRSLRRKPSLILGLNKIDKLPAPALELVRADYQALIPDAAALAFSAASHQGLKELLDALTARLPARPAEFPEEQVTDLYEREIAADLIREAALVFLRDEVPHALAVRLDEFSERENGNAYIAATLLVERDSQKGIVIGEKGAMLKKIGSAARKEIEAMSGRKVFLELRVKVEKDWRDNENALRRLGYKIKGKK